MKNKLNLLSFLLPLFEAELGGGGGDVASTLDAGSSDSADSSPAIEAFGASPEGEQVATAATAPSETETAQAEPDIFEGIPSVEQLTEEAARKVPGSEGLLRLRTELERISPQVKQFEPWKPVIEGNDPAKIAERLQAHDSLFSPKLENGQPVLDERGLPQTTAQPFLESMEAKQPGYAMSHFLDVMDLPTVNPATGQKEPLIGQFFREVLGLDVSRLEQYQNIDSLIAKTNGSITPEELGKVPEPDHEAYKSLPSGLRKDWEYMDEETRRFHLDGAKDRLENKQFREQQTQAQQKAEEEYKQNFEAQVQQEFVQDLAQVREQAFSSLRDNLAKDWQPTQIDEATRERYYDDVLAPLVQLIDPDLQPMALKRLEREGILVNVQEFNEQMRVLTESRRTFVRATAYNDSIAADNALKDYNRVYTQLMAKMNVITLARAEKYGYQAKTIADKKGELLTTASQVRPTVPGSTAPQTFNATGLPAGMDPRSSEAAMLQYRQSIGQA